MQPCHTKPFVAPGVVIATSRAATTTENDAPAPEESPRDHACDYCGAAELEWRKCKLICNNCKQINKSCADL